MTHPAGWYPDPSSPQQQRYWDGTIWTERTQPALPAVPAKKKRHAVRTVLTVLGVLLVAFIGLGFMVAGQEGGTGAVADTPTDPDFANPATYRPLDEREFQVLIKDPGAAVGKKYVIYGDVAQLDAATGDSTMRVNATATPDPMAFGDNTIVNVRDPQLLKPVVSGDAVKLFVTVAGALSYDTQIGGSTTVPEFTAAIVEVLPS